ncbi:MAG: flagella basal body P-ring formation protein FlgA [Spirochaetes bacterium]|nr:flagella basal body P-ring formation protein FlgA [Spirochaetota bacterium]
MRWWHLVPFVINSAFGAMGGEVRIYLNSEITAAPIIRIGEIAIIETNEKIDISNIVIPPETFADGYIESGEVRELISSRYDGLFVRIVGHAVRVKSIGERKSDSEMSTINDDEIKNGERVEVVLQKKGITVKTFGTALNDGKKGDSIFVKTDQSKRIFGKIVGRGTIEVLP